MLIQIVKMASMFFPPGGIIWYLILRRKDKRRKKKDKDKDKDNDKKGII
jgi:hypothetical protein